jgi:dsRNA-specific ribonuclease
MRVARFIASPAQRIASRRWVDAFRAMSQSAEPPAQGEPRAAINRLKLSKIIVGFSFTEHASAGPAHEPIHTCCLKITREGASPRSFAGSGPSKAAAEDAASAAALDNLDPQWRQRFSPGLELERLAHVGDAALDLVVSVYAFRQGLPPKTADKLRTRVLSNEALSGGVQGKLRATEAEARFGKALVERHDIAKLLEAVVDEVDPALMDRLRRAAEGVD